MSPARPSSRPRQARGGDDLTFSLALRDPFGLVLEAWSKPTANALFAMPEAVAKTPATAQISSAVGSGLFIFVEEEWRPGSKAVYVRNPDYLPRREKPDGLAGGKVVKVDRVEWLSMPIPPPPSRRWARARSTTCRTRPWTPIRC